MIVVDASAILEVLLRTPAALPIEERLFDRGEALHAPHVIDLEVLQVLRRYEAAGEVSAERAREALDDLAAFRLRRWAMTRLPCGSGSCGKTSRPTTPPTSLWPRPSARRF